MACASLASMALSSSPHILLRQQVQTKDSSIHWNSILKRHARLKDDHAILATYAEMEASGAGRDRLSLPVVLKACARLRDVRLGRKIHHDIISTELIEDLRIRTALLDFFSRCGFLDDALELFEEMGERDLVSWNAMISGCVTNCRYDDAVSLYFRMRREGLKPNSVTLVNLLSASRELSALRLGQEIHCYALRNGIFEPEPHLGTALIGFYSKFNVKFSCYVFELMVTKNVVSWNAIINTYFLAGDVAEALKLFVQILESDVVPDSVTILATLQSCIEAGCVELGEQVHQLAIKCGFSSDNFVGNALIDMYGKFENLESSYLSFEKMNRKDLPSWNAMIAAYRNCKHYDEAFGLFTRMQLEGIEHNMVTIATLLSVCAESGDLHKGRQLHAYAVKNARSSDDVIYNALLSMYVELNYMKSAQEIFYSTDKSNVISWNTLLIGLINNGMTFQAWDLFWQLHQTGTKPNSYTMVSLLAGCKDESFSSVGRSIHGYVIRHGLLTNSSLSTALADMYMDCGHESAAVHIFWNCLERDLVSWNAMIASYVRSRQLNEALSLFYQMQLEVKRNAATMIIVLSACAHAGNLIQGRCMHAYILRSHLGLPLDIPLANALLAMYAKCGSIRYAETVFGTLSKRDNISWNAMIAAYGMHGRGEDAVRIFYEMIDTGQRPTSVTFVSVLAACSHTGLVAKGWELFHSMARDYTIRPEVVHYACMVDLLGRAGDLHTANHLIHLMPMEPDGSVLRALLSACRVYSNTELANIIAEKLIKLEPANIANYILLSNIYAGAGNWEEVNSLRATIKEKGLEKTPGNSWINIRNSTQAFTAGDKLQCQSNMTSHELTLLIDKLVEDESFPNFSEIFNGEDKDKRYEKSVTA